MVEEMSIDILRRQGLHDMYDTRHVWIFILLSLDIGKQTKK